MNPERHEPELYKVTSTTVSVRMAPTLGGSWVREEDIAALEDENKALRAEISRFTEFLREPWGAASRFQPLIAQPGEVRFLDLYDRALTSEEVEELWRQWAKTKKVLSAQEITKPGWYWWRRSVQEPWEKAPRLVIQFRESPTQHNTVFRFGKPDGDWDASKVFTGQFSGPLPRPES